jgi:hypothetical protein
MPRRLPNELSGRPERPRGTISGQERIARRFLPACPASTLIRLGARDPRRALSRRRLARLFDSRRVVS